MLSGGAGLVEAAAYGTVVASGAVGAMEMAVVAVTAGMLSVLVGTVAAA